MIQLSPGKEFFYAIIIDKSGMVRFDNPTVVPDVLRDDLLFDKQEPVGRQYYLPLTTYREWENGINANDSK